MDIREAARSLADHLAPHRTAGHWLVSVSTGSDQIHVFVVSKRWLGSVPSEWEGWPVKATATGRFRLC